MSSGYGRVFGGLELKKGRRLFACGPLVVVLLSKMAKAVPSDHRLC